MSFIYSRTIYLSDTDAAGVVFFANVLVICHEAYEESLAAAGINFQALVSNGEIAIPIVHANVDFYRPLFCGDKLFIQLAPQQLSESEFEIVYSILSSASDKPLAKAKTRHVCIHLSTRKRTLLSTEIRQWLRE